jgi:hypothetical protein
MRSTYFLNCQHTYETYIVNTRHFLSLCFQLFFKFRNVLVFITQGCFVFPDDCFGFCDSPVFLLHDPIHFSFDCLGICFKFLDELSLFQLIIY